MSERDTIMKAAVQVAGVSLRRPQLWYAETQPWGTAVLLRDSQDPRLEHATLRLELGPEAVGQYAPKGSVTAVDKVRFAMKDWLAAHAPVNPFDEPDERVGQAVWRSLLVEQGLLAHPELILTGAEVPEIPATPSPMKEMDDACAQALGKLRLRFESLVAVHKTQPIASSVRCEECLRLDEARVHALPRLPGGFRPPPQLRGIWERIMGVKQDCVHAPLARGALQALCKRSPELIFELLGWLVPEGALPHGRPGTAPTRESRRFVLEPAALELLLGNWLLAERAPGARRQPVRGPRGYGRPHWERRNFHLSAAARQAQAGSALPAGLRAGVSFAAAAWGIEVPIEQLAWRPAMGGESAPARKPMFDVKASDRLDVPRFLPDVAPPQEPPPGREAPRRRGPKREAGPPRSREVRRRAK